MAKQQHLSRAPITEALIDIRVTLPAKAREINHLAGLDESFRSQYPDKKTIQRFQYKVELGASHSEETSSKPLGFRYTSADSSQVIQATSSGLTFSRLPPYQDWSKLRQEGNRVWKIYSDHVRPETITRVAVRYINKLTLPGPHIDFDQYLNYVPIVPKALPQVLGGFFSRIVVPDEKAQCVAIITQHFQPSPSEIAVLLDIDVFREKVFAGDEEAWATLDHLRDFKNLIFFDSITEKTVKVYE
ncbi:MAG: TIGR04255 family protein [Nitrospirota bacterium]